MPDLHTRRRLLERLMIFAMPVLLFSLIFGFYSNDAIGQEMPPALVKTAPVVKKTVSEQVSLIGTTEPALTSIVACEAEGVVEHFPVKEGDFVKKGSLLARLDSRELLLRKKAAAASREKIKVNLENAKKELERVNKLKQSDAVAQRRFDDTESVYRALVQELSRSEAEIELLEYDLSRHEVSAPVSGFITREHTQIGEWLRKGSPVVTLIDLQKILISVPVPERYMVQLGSRENALITVKSISDQPLSGKVHSVLSQGDSNSRTFSVKVSVENPNYRIKSGMEALVTFNLAGSREALLVPKDAVVNAGRERLVFKVNDGKAVPSIVEILGYYDGNAAVSGELKPGDQVVVRGNERLRPGQPVRSQ
ncbi:MAG: efflux RND transporter periplasmic adaptor subunit [Thermodesulfobacteriota bacterium]